MSDRPPNNVVPFTTQAGPSDIPPRGFRTNFHYSELPEHIQRWLKEEWALLTPAQQAQVEQTCRHNERKAKGAAKT